MKTKTGLTITYKKNGNIKVIKSDHNKDFSPYKSFKKIRKEERLNFLYTEHNKNMLTKVFKGFGNSYLIH